MQKEIGEVEQKNGLKNQDYHFQVQIQWISEDTVMIELD